MAFRFCSVILDEDPGGKAADCEALCVHHESYRGMMEVRRLLVLNWSINAKIENLCSVCTGTAAILDHNLV